MNQFYMIIIMLILLNSTLIYLLWEKEKEVDKKKEVSIFISIDDVRKEE